MFLNNCLSDEGKWYCPRCTVFGLDEKEIQTLIGLGFTITKTYKDEEGLEIDHYAFKASLTFNIETIS